MGHAHCPNDEIYISCELERPTLVFFSCIMPLGKPDSKSIGKCHTWFFDSVKKPTFNLIEDFILCVQSVFTTENLFTWVGAYGQTSIGT